MPGAAVLLTVEYKTASYEILGDNSGFELYLSDELLPIEAGILAVGQTPDHRFFIPPGVGEWTTKGTCHRSCFYGSAVSVVHLSFRFYLYFLTLASSRGRKPFCCSHFSSYKSPVSR